jgi:hypothetical protein
MAPLNEACLYYDYKERIRSALRITRRRILVLLVFRGCAMTLPKELFDEPGASAHSGRRGLGAQEGCE